MLIRNRQKVEMVKLAGKRPKDDDGKLRGAVVQLQPLKDHLIC